jgi:hypothetical protein
MVRLLCSKKVQPLGVRFFGPLDSREYQPAPEQSCAIQGDLEDAGTESAFRNAPATSPLRGHTSSVAEGGQGWQARREDTVTPRLSPASSSGFCKNKTGDAAKQQLGSFRN